MKVSPKCLSLFEEIGTKVIKNMQKFSVLFVCLGNICRSPLGEVIFKDLVKQDGLEDRFLVESCGTGGWHVGQGAHEGSVEIAARHGISLDEHVARKLCADDFKRFNLLVAMDRSNLQDIKKRKSSKDVRSVCLREYDDEADDLDVPDPYYLPRDSFKTVFDIVHRSCQNLLVEIKEEHF